MEAGDEHPGNLDAQIHKILAALTADTSVWAALAARFRVDIFCDLFMEETNEGLVISPETLGAMSVRGVTLSLDIYGPTPD